MTAPGGLIELGDDADEWDQRVADVASGVGLPSALRNADPSNATELRVPDWPAVPARTRSCLGRERSDRLCDARNAAGETGRTMLQEEYAEWRVIHDADGPVRIELTTELADYWELLARHAPRLLVELVTNFAAEKSIAPSEVFGGHDPLGEDSDEHSRAEAFSRGFLGWSIEEDKRVGRPGPLNNGERAITCLSRRDNSLRALVNLVAASAKPMLIIDRESSEPRFPSGSEAIPMLREGAAQDCRASDPVVVERVVRLATEGRLIRFDDPIGIYIVAVQHQDLLDPDGKPIPKGWIELTRQGPETGDGLSRHQRMTLEVPEGTGFKLSDLSSRRTGERIRRGAQIAELVELAVYVRVSEPGRLTVDPFRLLEPGSVPCASRDDCSRLEADVARLDGG